MHPESWPRLHPELAGPDPGENQQELIATEPYCETLLSFVVLSSRNIGESSSSTSTLTSIQPNTQRLPAVIISHLTASTDLPHDQRGPTTTTHDQCMQAITLDRDTMPALHIPQLQITMNSLPLVCGAPGTSTASVYAGPGTSEPVRALSRPSSRLPLEMISQFSTCLCSSYFDSRVCLAGASQDRLPLQAFPRDGF